MFPLTVFPYLLGGLLIGLGVSLIYALTGLHATQSSFYSTSLSFFSRIPYFRQESYMESRSWRLIFAAGVIIGAVAYTVAWADGTLFTTSVQWWRLLLGGLLVGFGTRLSEGCTSGHGISGLASLSTTSLVAVVTFLSVGILTALTLQALGIAP